MNLASESAVQTITRLQSATGSMPLVPAVRITVLKTMIPLAFPEEDITVAHSVARLITDKINLLWTISKEDSDDMIKDEKQILHLVIKASSATLTTRGIIPLVCSSLYTRQCGARYSSASSKYHIANGPNEASGLVFWANSHPIPVELISQPSRWVLSRGTCQGNFPPLPAHEEHLPSWTQAIYFTR